MWNSVKTTVTTTEAQANLPRLLRQLTKEKAVTITNHGRIAGFLISKERMEAIIETMEILANPKAMKAIRDFETGRSRAKDISCLDE
jgi:antitoxin YefM